MSQTNFPFAKIQTVNINHQPEPTQSKDDIIKARIEPRNMDQIRAFCHGRQITVSDYVRQYLQLDPSYFDFIALLNECRGELVPLLKRMSKNH